MTLKKATQPQIIKTPVSGTSSSRLPLLEEIKAEGKEGTWYVLGTWANPATASKFARGLARANTSLRKVGDPQCPPGRWEAGVQPLDDGQGAEVRVRFMGELVEGEDPFG
jgi:hypothetical protein